MASAQGELEEQLVQAGNRLLEPPSSVDELLPLLDQVENLLSRVEQSPSKSMQTALSPSKKGLAADGLLRHADIDVKVAVASCISEITRITAPDAPYDDDLMKEFFELIVSSFEDLSDKSSRSYDKRTLILETLAKVRSCVIMLDLECDGLIVKMFQHFLQAIRDYHPENVFASMETVMTLVLEESEDISFELISSILPCLKRDNQEVLPIARKLGEKVFGNCAVKLKPYLIQAKKSLGFSLDDYSDLIVHICYGENGAGGHDDGDACAEQMAEENKLIISEGISQADDKELAKASLSDAAQEKVTTERVTDLGSAGDSSALRRSLKSVMSNGDAEAGNGEKLADTESSKNPEHVQEADKSFDTNVTTNAEPDDLDSGNIVKSESKAERTSKKRGRKAKPSITSTEPSSSKIDSKKEAERPVDDTNEVDGSPSKGPSAEVAVSSENEKDIVQLSSSKASEREQMNVTSPSPGGSIPDEGRPKKEGQPKKKENLIQEVPSSADVVSKKASEMTTDSEAKTHKRSRKKASAGNTTQEKAPSLVDTSKGGGVTTSNSEAKPMEQPGEKVDPIAEVGDGSPVKKEDGRRRGRGKATWDKVVTKSSAEDDDKEMVSSPRSASRLLKDEGLLEETTKMSSKRKRTPGKEKASDDIEYGGNLVGSKVKVWWPKDQMFYEGVIDSYDRVKKKHKVLYTDGEVENLYLRKERWEYIGGETMSDGEQGTEGESPEPSLEMHKKKKAKSNSETSAKQEKRGGEASSCKSKKAATKSVRKARGAETVNDKSKDGTCESDGKSEDDSGGKSEDDSGGKSKDRSKKSSGKSGDTSRAAGKYRHVDSSAKEISTKSKQGTLKSTTQDSPKTATKSKGKASKTNANGSGKVKSGSLKGTKETEREEKLLESKTPESAKGKSQDTSKSRQAKSSKKRGRRG